MKIKIHPYTLKFTFDAGTSRGVLREKKNYFIVIDDEHSGRSGIGECGPLVGLSIDDFKDYHIRLDRLSKTIKQDSLQSILSHIQEFLDHSIPNEWPAARFGFETALLDLKYGGIRKITDNPFYDKGTPISINGLVWMGDADFMNKQIRNKINAGFHVIKIKVGAIDFDAECRLLEMIRREFGTSVEIRLDANGAFSPKEAMDKLNSLSQFDIHSIEQPIRAGQWEDMAKICRESPIDIALDEELIGISNVEDKQNLLETISPKFIILKPTLVGGLLASEEWINIAQSMNIGWWLTSALESNIGLNAIAQYASYKNVNLPQGLGTGQLYHNNIPSPLFIENGSLHYNTKQPWQLDEIIH